MGTEFQRPTAGISRKSSLKLPSDLAPEVTTSNFLPSGNIQKTMEHHHAING